MTTQTTSGQVPPTSPHAMLASQTFSEGTTVLRATCVHHADQFHSHEKGLLIVVSQIVVSQTTADGAKSLGQVLLAESGLRGLLDNMKKGKPDLLFNGDPQASSGAEYGGQADEHLTLNTSSKQTIRVQATPALREWLSSALDKPPCSLTIAQTLLGTAHPFFKGNSESIASLWYEFCETYLSTQAPEEPHRDAPQMSLAGLNQAQRQQRLKDIEDYEAYQERQHQRLQEVRRLQGQQDAIFSQLLQTKHNTSAPLHALIYGRAYEEGHSSGYHDVEVHYEELLDFSREVMKIAQGEP